MPRFNRNSGFTLLEIMISLIIVTTALVGLQSVIATNIERTDAALKKRMARTLARTKLEEYLASGGQESGEGGFEDEQLSGFRYRITTEDVAVGENRNIVRATITVSAPLDEDADFGDDSSGPNEFSLTTFIKAPEQQ